MQYFVSRELLLSLRLSLAFRCQSVDLTKFIRGTRCDQATTVLRRVVGALQFGEQVLNFKLHFAQVIVHCVLISLECRYHLPDMRQQAFKVP